MYSLKLLVVLCSAHCMLAQFLPLQYTSTEGSSEENAGQAPGPRTTSCPCGWTNKHGRIVGGKQVSPNEFPMMVGIMEQWGGLFCGGSIITERHVLTAAHCTVGKKNSQLRVMIGTHDVSFTKRSPSTQIIDVDYTIEHPQYNKRTYANDVALLVLKKPIQYNQFVGPVCLPTERTNLLDKYIKVIGWGYLDHRTRQQPDHLMKVNLKVIEMNNCEWFRNAYGLHVNKDNQICTFRKAKDSCNGDSGGPLVWVDPETNRLTQVALVSYGSPKCGVEDKPAVNTNVFDYLPWIKAAIAASGKAGNICQKV